MGIPYLSTCRPVSLSACLPGMTGPEVNIGVLGIMGIPYLSAVDLSTCPSGLTGPEINIGEPRPYLLIDLSTPAQMARDCARRKAFWKRVKVARKLNAENWAAHYARLEETKSVASPHVSVVSHPENSRACLEPTPFVSETRTVASPQVGFCGQSSSEFWGLFGAYSLCFGA